jgi:hypothetical protein
MRIFRDWFIQRNLRIHVDYQSLLQLRYTVVSLQAVEACWEVWPYSFLDFKLDGGFRSRLGRFIPRKVPLTSQASKQIWGPAILLFMKGFLSLKFSWAV